MFDFSCLVYRQSVKIRGNRRFTVIFMLAIAISLWFTPVGMTQDEDAGAIAPTEPTPVAIPSDGLYFADVLVRNRPVFQIGSLPQIDASARADIINRRIASLLSQNETPDKVEIAPDNPRKIATLRVNNRILMTVTKQDAEDFGISTEELAQRWKQQLDTAFEKPPLAIDVTQRLYTTTRELLRDIVGNLPSLVGAIIVIGITFYLSFHRFGTVFGRLHLRDLVPSHDHVVAHQALGPGPNLYHRPLEDRHRRRDW